MDPAALFILESFLAYLISMAAGLRTSAICDKAQRRLRRDLESISHKIQDFLIQKHLRTDSASSRALKTDQLLPGSM
jgi:histidinol phosphatase-like enzyme